MKKNLNFNFIVSIILSLFLAFCFGNNQVFAEEDAAILQMEEADSKIVSYIQFQDEITEVTGQIGTTSLENISFKKLNETEEKFHTIILVDNSLSMTKESREKIEKFLNEYISVKQKNELISIANYGEDISFLIEDEADQNTLTESIQNMEYNDQDTFLTDVLYDLLDTIDANSFTKFILISDGVDNKSIGITKDELIEKLKANNRPVYTIGHIYKKNESKLENFFALSRISNAKSALLDDFDDVRVLAEEFSTVDHLYKVEAVLPNGIKDGSRKSVLFNVVSSNGNTELKGSFELSFELTTEEPTVEETTVEESTVEETTVEEISTELATEEESTEAVEEEIEEKSSPMKKIILVIIIIAAATYVLLNRKKSKTTKKDKKVEENKSVPVKAVVEMPSVATELNENIPNDSRRFIVILHDRVNQNIVYKYPLNDRVLIGRNDDMVNIAVENNLTISGKHCEIYRQNNKFMIRDLGSSNGTFVNGHICKTECEINNGTVIRLGDLDLIVDFEQI